MGLRASTAGSGQIAASEPHRRPAIHRNRRRANHSTLRQVGRVIWMFPRHAALAFVTGLIAGSIASRFGGVLGPPYAAILAATVVYPALAMACRVIPR